MQAAQVAMAYAAVTPAALSVNRRLLGGQSLPSARKATPAGIPSSCTCNGGHSGPCGSRASRVVAKLSKDDVAKTAGATAAGLFLISALPGDAFAVTGIKASDIGLDAAIAKTSELGAAALDASKVATQLAGDATEALTPLFNKATPLVKSAAESALQAATPFVKEAEKQLSASGINTSDVYKTGKTVLDTSVNVGGQVIGAGVSLVKAGTPVVVDTVQTISASDPQVIAAGLVVAGILYVSSPAIFNAISKAIRGYAGDVSAAEALTLLVEGGHILVDVRTDKSKAANGIPKLPRNANGRVVQVSTDPIEDRKLRGMLRNPGAVENTITAVKVAAFKGLGKGSRLVLLDESGGNAKRIATSLSKLGFGNVYVLSGGFSAWTRANLATEDYGVTVAEVIRPSKVIVPSSTVSRVFSPPAAKEAPRLPGMSGGSTSLLIGQSGAKKTGSRGTQSGGGSRIYDTFVGQKGLPPPKN